VVIIAGIREVWATDELRLDFYVYHQAIQEMLAGRGLYSYSLTVFDGVFPFTYPPFAALVLVPVVLPPIAWGQAIWMVLQLGLVVLLAWLIFHRALPGRTPPGWLGDAAVVGTWVVLVFNAPVAQSLWLGQISMVVVSLVVVDTLAVPKRFRGVLTGIAGAMKLLPLIFLPYYLFTRQWRAAANTAGGFAAATAISAVILPQDSLLYWTQTIVQTSRVGEIASLRNKSLLGLLSRLDAGPGEVWWWLVLAVGFGAIGLWRAWRHHQRGEEFSAVVVMGLLSGLIAPITWLHHLVWLSVAMVCLAVIGGRWWRIVAAAMAIGFSVFSPVVTSMSSGSMAMQVVQSATVVTLMAFVVFGLPSTAAVDRQERGADE
jgi:alpha-1,2-mannosyltransferase